MSYTLASRLGLFYYCATNITCTCSLPTYPLHTHTHPLPPPKHTHIKLQTKSLQGILWRKKTHPGVNAELLTEIFEWQEQGLDWKDILNRLRPRTVLPGYTYHPWKAGKPISFVVDWKSYVCIIHCYFIGTKVEDESEVDMLRSILAQLEFQHVVRQ